MNTFLELKNFRVFDEKNGGLFRLSPITVLTGCNSSGKSSVTKALLLLRDFFSNIHTNKVDDCKLNFGNKVTKLGRYDLVRNCNSSPKSKMCFSYIVRGKHIDDHFLIEMYFATRSNDKTNSGWVDRIIVKKGREERVLLDVDYSKEGNVVIRKIDLNVVKEDFLYHVYNDLLQSQETMTLPAEELSGNDELEEVNQKNLKILDQIIAALKKHTTEEQFTRIVDNIELGSCGSVYESEYNMPIYLSSNEHDIIFSFPIFDILKNIKKSDTRSTILFIIDSCDRKNSDGSKYEFQYKNALDAVLREFEESNYSDFISYYRAKESEGLLFKDLMYIKNEIAVFGSHSDKNGMFTQKIDGISYLLSQGLSLRHQIRDEYWNSDIQSNIKPSSYKYIYTVMEELLEYIEWHDRGKWILGHGDVNTAYYQEHIVFSDLCQYFDNLIFELLSPEQYLRFTYVGDSSIEVKRLYSLDKSDDMGVLLDKYLEACRKNTWGDIEPGQFINKWIRAFGIGDRVSIDITSEGYGAVIRLFKSSEDKKGRLLVDEGFGITKFVVTLINIEYVILSMQKRHGVYSMITNDGKISGKCRSYTTISIEEPENHLHPRFQSLLADMIVDAYKNYHVEFIVETHSEYLIRKLQTLVAKKELKPNEVSLQYVYDASPENRPKGEPHVKNIAIRPDGTLQEPFGSGFFDEADNLAMDLLTIKAMS